MTNGVQKKEVDVLVLGAGAAGAVAASALRKHNYKVALLAKCPGATAQSSGAVDVGGKAQNGPLKEALDELQGIAHHADLVRREDGRPWLLATQMGTLKHSAMVQKSQAFDFDALEDGDVVCILGYTGLASFDARAVSRMLAWSLNETTHKSIRVEPLVVDFKPRVFRSPLEMALALENPDVAADFVQQSLSAQAKMKEARAFLSPAILSRVHLKHLWQSLNDDGAPFFELLALPHAVPGLRLHDSLMRGLHECGTEMLWGEATHFIRANSQIKSVTAKIANERVEISARAFVLATGRFFAGGFTREGPKHERLFGLPIWERETSLFRAGLRVDAKMRPFDQFMELFALNLFAAGSSLGGYDAGDAEGGMGLSALSAYMAALHTIEALKTQEDS